MRSGPGVSEAADQPEPSVASDADDPVALPWRTISGLQFPPGEACGTRCLSCGELLAEGPGTCSRSGRCWK